MKISVIIPTYNRKEKLKGCLASVMSQSKPADEIIVVDDGSEDGTDRMIKETFPEVNYIFSENKGVSHARNLGIKAAKGEWLAFLDSDDKWESDKLAQQSRAIENEPEYLICHTDEIWIRSGVRVNPMQKHQKRGGWIYRYCLPLCVISPSSVMIHREIFEKIGLFDEDLPACEDYDLWLRITALYPILYLDKPLVVKCGGHEDQLSKRYFGMDRFRIKALRKQLYNSDLKWNDKKATFEMLKEKIQIYCLGAKKRNKEEEIKYYEKLLREDSEWFDRCFTNSTLR